MMGYEFRGTAMRMARAVGAPATRSFSTFSCWSAQKNIKQSEIFMCGRGWVNLVPRDSGTLGADRELVPPRCDVRHRTKNCSAGSELQRRPRAAGGLGFPQWSSNSKSVYIADYESVNFGF